MGSRVRRAWRFAGWSVASGALLWVALRFGVLAWLSDKNSPVRPVVEALSWVAAVAGFVVALVALMLARHQVTEAADAGGTREENRPGSVEKIGILVVNSEGTQVGDHTKQKNIFKNFFTGWDRTGGNSRL